MPTRRAKSPKKTKKRRRKSASNKSMRFPQKPWSEQMKACWRTVIARMRT